MNPIINIEELTDIYTDPNVVIVDVSNEKDAKNNFEKVHISGALFINLNEELSAIPDDPKNGGRHPLIDISEFVSVLESKGITNRSHVICYDNSFGANAAARFWWMLRAIGHEKVQVLNGGFQILEKYNFLLSNESSNLPSVAKYHIKQNTNWRLPLVKIQDVLENTVQKKIAVIDVREPERFLGVTEPIDLIAGHIPGAINIPFKSNLTSAGFFKSKAEIIENYSNVSSDIIIHCGSGVTACHSILAMDYAGLSIPSLYVGSWSEWSRSENPIAKGLI